MAQGLKATQYSDDALPVQKRPEMPRVLTLSGKCYVSSMKINSQTPPRKEIETEQAIDTRTGRQGVAQN